MIVFLLMLNSLWPVEGLGGLRQHPAPSVPSSYSPALWVNSQVPWQALWLSFCYSLCKKGLQCSSCLRLSLGGHLLSKNDSFLTHTTPHIHTHTMTWHWLPHDFSKVFLRFPVSSVMLWLSAERSSEGSWEGWEGSAVQKQNLCFYVRCHKKQHISTPHNNGIWKFSIYHMNENVFAFSAAASMWGSWCLFCVQCLIGIQMTWQCTSSAAFKRHEMVLNWHFSLIYHSKDDSVSYCSYLVTRPCCMYCLPQVYMGLMRVGHQPTQNAEREISHQSTSWTRIPKYPQSIRSWHWRALITNHLTRLLWKTLAKQVKTTHAAVLFLFF